MELAMVGDRHSWPSFSLLAKIDVCLENGKPTDETRHPNLGSGLRWPPLELFDNATK
jgi:hypothetical protein